MIAYQTGPRAGQQRADASKDADRVRLASDLARWAGDRAVREHCEYIAAGRVVRCGDVLRYAGYPDRTGSPVLRLCRSCAPSSHGCGDVLDWERSHSSGCCERAREDAERSEYSFAIRLPIAELISRHSANAKAVR